MKTNPAKPLRRPGKISTALTAPGVAGLGLCAYLLLASGNPPPAQTPAPAPDRKLDPGCAAGRSVAEEPDTAEMTVGKGASTALELLRQALGSKDPRRQEAAMEKLIPACLAIDAAETARMVARLPAGPWRERALRLLAQTWAGSDARVALDWAARLPDKTERSVALADACLGVAEKDPRLALQLAAEYRIPDNALWANLTQQWAEQDMPAASSWVARLAPGAERDRLLQRVAFVESKADPVQAARLAIEQISPGDTQNEAVISVLQQWGQKDLLAATDWVRRFPDGELRDRALAEVEGVAASRRLLE